MTISEETEMGKSEISEFLGQQETGVLALADDESVDPYAIPISYGYDAESGKFYMRLVSTPESEKREFLSSSPSARLVVYEEADPTYESVIATGTLEKVDPSELSVEQIEQYGQAKRPLFEIWTEPRRDLDIELYVLDAAELSGRRIEIDRDDES